MVWQIALGVWVGLTASGLTLWAVVSGLEAIAQNRRYGRPWWRWWH